MAKSKVNSEAYKPKIVEEKLIDLLNEKAFFYESPEFIENDPIQIPHRFSNKKDIEIAAFFAATIAWGQRKSIISSANRLMEIMDDAPADFIGNFEEIDLKKFQNFVHRTFNSDDAISFVCALRKLYETFDSLEDAFLNGSNMAERLSNFKMQFFQSEHLPRSRKHVSDPLKGSAAKRLNMFLRWMVRSNAKGVDFGIWQKIKTKDLMIPLDVHTATVARRYGLLLRKQDDWKALEELMSTLRNLCPEDPVKYDFALFGIGAFEKIKV